MNKLLDIEKRKNILKACKKCGKKFFILKSRIKNGKGKFCSIKCKGLYFRKVEVRICINCNRKFIRKVSNIKQGGGKFCSRKCASRGKFNPAWKGGIRKKTEYIYSYIDELEKFKEKINNLTEAQKSYIAGLLDGEGSIGLYQDKRRITNSILARVTIIVNKDIKLIDTIYEWIGGEKVRKYNTITDCKVIVIQHRIFIEIFLKAIVKYLIAKKERAEMMLEFITLRKGRFHHNYVQRELELVELSKKGNFMMGKAIRV